MRRFEEWLFIMAFAVSPFVLAGAVVLIVICVLEGL